MKVNSRIRAMMKKQKTYGTVKLDDQRKLYKGNFAKMWTVFRENSERWNDKAELEQRETTNTKVSKELRNRH